MAWGEGPRCPTCGQWVHNIKPEYLEKPYYKNDVEFNFEIEEDEDDSL